MASHHTRFAPSIFGLSLRIAGCITVSGLMLAGDLNVALAQSDSGAAAKPSSASSTKADGRARLNMQGASWKKALRRIARHGGIELVMKATPPGTFSCADTAEHSVPEALRIVNRQLEPLGYRASQQGSFLVVLNLDSLRSGYNSPTFIRPRQDPTVAAAQAAAAPTATAGAAPTTTDAVQVSANAPEPNVAPAIMELNTDSNAGHSATPAEADAAKEHKEPKTPNEEKIEKADNSPQIRIWFVSAKWPQVLQSLCDQSGLTLVAKKVPSDTVKFRDWKKYRTDEIIAFLNKELESDQSNFRLEREDKFLLVIDKEDLRSEYERPIYFVETREGHTCCWCSMRREDVILQPHPLSPVPVRVLRHPQEAEIIGQVVGVAMKLTEWQPMGSSSGSKGQPTLN